MAASRLALIDATNGGDELLVLTSVLQVLFSYFFFRFHHRSVLAKRHTAQSSRLKVTPFYKIRLPGRDIFILNRVPYALRLVPLLILSLVPCAAVAGTATVTIGWDKNPEPDIAGYRIHYGIKSGAYDYSVNVGNSTSCDISGLEEDTTYYFAATAYNTMEESDLSEEIVYNTSSAPDPSTDALSTISDALEFASNDASEPSFYQITASAGSGGIISPEGEVTVSPTSSAIYSIQPNANYHIADVKVDGNSIGAVTSYTFKDVNADHTITASFDADTVASSSGKKRGWRKWWRRR